MAGLEGKQQRGQGKRGARRQGDKGGKVLRGGGKGARRRRRTSGGQGTRGARRWRRTREGREGTGCAWVPVPVHYDRQHLTQQHASTGTGESSEASMLHLVQVCIVQQHAEQKGPHQSRTQIEVLITLGSPNATTSNRSIESRLNPLDVLPAGCSRTSP